MKPNSQAPLKARYPWHERVHNHPRWEHDAIVSLGYDWGRVADPAAEPSPPLKVYLPRCTDDVVKAVLEARALGQRLTVRGSGHSSNDLVAACRGALLLTSGLRAVFSVDESGLTVTVGAGMAMAEADARLGERGLGLPVVGDHRHLTVGGFVSVGGVSGASFRHGLFVDTVLAVEVVTWDGDVRWCSRDDHPEQFEDLVAGLGRHGVIVSVKARVVREDKDRTIWRKEQRHFRTLDAFLAGSQQDLSEPPSGTQFMRGLWLDVPFENSASGLRLGQFSLYNQVVSNAFVRGRARSSDRLITSIGYVSGRLPRPFATGLKYGASLGVLFGPRYVSVSSAERFSDRLLDATAGEPTRFFGILAPLAVYPTVAAQALSLFARHRQRSHCFTFSSLYVKGITSPYLKSCQIGDERWVELVVNLGVRPAALTGPKLDEIVDELDDTCIDLGALRYMHTRTSRDQTRVARVDANLVRNRLRAPAREDAPRLDHFTIR